MHALAYEQHRGAPREQDESEARVSGRWLATRVQLRIDTAFRSVYGIRTAPGHAVRMRTPTLSYASTSPRARQSIQCRRALRRRYRAQRPPPENTRMEGSSGGPRPFLILEAAQ